MKLVYLESPYAGAAAANWFHARLYARDAMRDSILRGEAPFASHLLYTQEGILNDDIPNERRIGIAAGLMWAAQAEATIVYDDLGISPGMAQGIRDAIAAGRPVEYRRLDAWAEARVAARRQAVEDLRGSRRWAEMSDDRAHTNGTITAINADIAKAEEAVTVAEAELAALRENGESPVIAEPVDR